MRAGIVVFAATLVAVAVWLVLPTSESPGSSGFAAVPEIARVSPERDAPRGVTFTETKPAPGDDPLSLEEDASGAGGSTPPSDSSGLDDPGRDVISQEGSRPGFDRSRRVFDPGAEVAQRSARAEPTAEAADAPPPPDPPADLDLPELTKELARQAELEQLLTPQERDDRVRREERRGTDPDVARDKVLADAKMGDYFARKNLGPDATAAEVRAAADAAKTFMSTLPPDTLAAHMKAAAQGL